MPRTRREIWKLGEGWSDTLEWYAKAVAEMRTRPINDPTSWGYLGAIHGFDKDLWREFGYLRDNEALPSQAERDRLWQQCQHQSWTSCHGSAVISDPSRRSSGTRSQSWADRPTGLCPIGITATRAIRKLESCIRP